MIQAFSSSGVWDIFVLWRYYHTVLFCFRLAQHRLNAWTDEFDLDL